MITLFVCILVCTVCSLNAQSTDVNPRTCTYSFVIPQTDVVTTCKSYSQDQINRLQTKIGQLQAQIDGVKSNNYSRAFHSTLSTYTCDCANKTAFELAYRDCQEVKQSDESMISGVYKIFPVKSVGTVIAVRDGKGLKKNKLWSTETYEPVNVYCDLSDDDLGWTVIMRRSKMDVSFDRTNVEFRNGFGNMKGNGDFWLGLEAMHRITHQVYANYTLWIVMKDEHNIPNVVAYRNFKVSDEKSGYQASGKLFKGENNGLGIEKPFIARNYSTTSRTSYSGYNRYSTSTYYDCLDKGKTTMGGGWWFTDKLDSYYRTDETCGSGNLNAPIPYWRGIDNIKRVEMKIRLTNN